ncbi:MAG: site-2 protease family protein, partial [Planctomycetota bacterium]
MSFIFDNPTLAVVALILGFGFLIFVHELGHFAVAKWVGIRATQFAIGFGQAIVSYRPGLGFHAGGTEKEYIARALDALKEEGKSIDGLDEHARNKMIMEKADALGLGETEYRLNWVPLGGYVKMLGQEDMDPNAQSDDPRAFNKKSVGARAAVISAGVIMNMIFGLIFFVLCFNMGVEFAAPVVGDVAPDMPAATTYARGHEGDPAFRGLQPGDVITHVHGEPIKDMTEVSIATALGKAGRAVPMAIERDGHDKPLVYDIVPVPSEANEGLLSAGIFGADTLVVSADSEGRTAADGTPFADAGLTKGMRVAAVNGESVANYAQYRRAFAALTDADVTLTFAEPDGGRTVEVAAAASPRLDAEPYGFAVPEGSDPPSNLLGLTPAVVIAPSAPDSPAGRAGVEPGDLLARLDTTDWPTREQVKGVVEKIEDDAALSVLRDGETLDLGTLRPRRGMIGVSLRPAFDMLRFGPPLPGSPVARASADRPIPAGSELVAIDGRSVSTWSEAHQAVVNRLDAAPTDEAVAIEFAVRVNLADRPTETHDVELSPTEVSRLREQLAWLPPGGVFYERAMVELKADSPVEAVALGADKTVQFVQQTYMTLLGLIQGTISPKNLRGPVGIVDTGAKISREGLPYFLFFLGLISVNLAVLNFLPIPIVDGGLMVFLIIEKLKGSPASP